ncbi:MAG: hypothetical protein FWC43_05870 [Planctomycetaceae bacterium]|nr:hypothetical protein [Planctomycetaceae bacterium]
MLRFGLICLVLLVCAGCGTTKWTDTSRTATEQLLISYAIDNAVEQINFSVLRGKKVFIKTDAIQAATDYQYLSTAIRQHISTSGGLLCDKLEDSEYIVELRAGAVGTDRNDLLYGVPAITIPSVALNNAATAGAGSTFPEIPFVKKTDQRAVCKVAVFVYHRETGRPLWCSGNRQSESRAKAWWVFGAGPFTKGSIYKGTEFDGGKIPKVIPGISSDNDEGSPPLTVERYFAEPPLVKTDVEKPQNSPDLLNPPAPIPKTIQYGGMTIHR